MTEIDISVIVPHYDQMDSLRLCLESLIDQTTQNFFYEIIVADNDTPGGIETIKTSFPTVTFVTATQKGAACARNAGMKVARGRVFAFIDADCVAHPAWLLEGRKSIKNNYLVGGSVDVTVKDQDMPSAVEAFEQVFAFRQQRYIEQKHFSVTANLFVLAADAERIGPFRNGVSEDVEWCHRARALGFHLAFNDKSIVCHPARRQWGELVSKWDRMISERWNGFGGHAPLRQFKWAGLAIVTAISIAPHTVRVLTTDKLSTFRSRLEAMQVLARIRCWRAIRMFSILFTSQASSK